MNEFRIETAYLGLLCDIKELFKLLQSKKIKYLPDGKIDTINSDSETVISILAYDCIEITKRFFMYLIIENNLTINDINDKLMQGLYKIFQNENTLYKIIKMFYKNSRWDDEQFIKHLEKIFIDFAETGFFKELFTNDMLKLICSESA